MEAVSPSVTNAPALPHDEGGQWKPLDLTSLESRRRLVAAAGGLIRGVRYGALYYDLEWRFREQSDWSGALVYAREGTGGYGAYAPFVRQSRPLPFRLGEVTVASAALQRYTLVGEPLLAENDVRRAAERIEELLGAIRPRLGNREALFFEGLPTDSPTYRVITTHDDVERNYLVVQLGAPFDHQFIELPATYADYMKQLGSRSRQSVQYSERKLERDMEGKVRAVCFEDSGTLDRFLADAEAVSRKTYQWNVLGLGLRSSEFEQRLRFAAGRGSLRSYILYCRDVPAAFMLGYQYGDCYYYTDVGYDPEYANWSVGSVLQLKVLQDLYARDNRPSLFDFSTGYGSHKGRFGNLARREANVLLLPNTVANRLLASAFLATERVSSAAVSFVDWLGLKARLKKAIRRFSTR